MSSSSPSPAPHRPPPPGYAPSAAMHNLQISRPPPPGAAPPPFAARPGPPIPTAASNGPLASAPPGFPPGPASRPISALGTASFPGSPPPPLQAQQFSRPSGPFPGTPPQQPQLRPSGPFPSAQPQPRPSGPFAAAPQPRSSGPPPQQFTSQPPSALQPRSSGPPPQQFTSQPPSAPAFQSYSGPPASASAPQLQQYPSGPLQFPSGPPQQFPGISVSAPPSQSYPGAPPAQPSYPGAPPAQRSYPGAPPAQPYGGPPPPQFSGPPAAQPYGGPPPPQFSGPPSSQPYGGPPQFTGSPSAPFVSGTGGPFGAQTPWQSQARPGVPMMTGAVPPQSRYGMPPGQPQSLPPVPPVMGHLPIGGPQGTTPSKIDPNQIPRPMSSGSVTTFETRQGNQANIPPPAISDYIVKDCGNSSPRLMRCTMNQIPCTSDLLSTSSMPLALMIQPLAISHPEEEPIQVVDFGESGPLRCSRCKGYVNPFMRFIDQGKRFICNLCGFTDETPRDYHCNLGPDGRRRDADDRPELCRGTVEFVATKEFMVRDPMPAVFFFVIDVSMNAIKTGATAAACSAIYQAIADLPETPRTMVGIATFDSAIHFYNLKRALQQPLMLIVPDVQDVYTPLHTDLIVQLTECRGHLEQLLDNIPTMFENNRVAESAFGAAIKATFLALKPTGGKLLVFQSVLPSIGIGSLSSREAEGRANVSSADKEAHKLLQPADKSLKTMAIEFAEYQVCVDIFITAQTFVDIASMSVVPRTTGGQVYYYYPFSALSDAAKLYNDLKWNLSRPQGFEAVMRVRCSQGLQVQEYSGNFCKRIPTDIDLPAIDCDKTIMVTFKHDDKFQDGTECSFQCALLYTTVFGQRRIRVTNLSLPCTTTLASLFRTADLDTQFACFLKQAASGIPMSPLSQVREQITNLCINILHSYRKFCATVSSSGQLILPEALKLLPLYTLALSKSIGLRNDGRLDDRSYWVSRAASLSISLAVPLVYPRMISVHDLTEKEEDVSLIHSTIPLSSENIQDGGVYLLENGEDALIYVGSTVNPDIIQQLFGVSSTDEIPTQLVLQPYDNDLSRKLNDAVNEIRRQRCSYLRLRLCRKGEPAGMLFFSYMVEDKAPGGSSYVEFLVHIHRQIQTKMG